MIACNLESAKVLLGISITPFSSLRKKGKRKSFSFFFSFFFFTNKQIQKKRKTEVDFRFFVLFAVQTNSKHCRNEVCCHVLFININSLGPCQRMNVLSSILVSRN